jgi:hypothetical protein
MRKLLLGTTALAAAATISANAVLADSAPTITGYYEWTYNSRSSAQTALDGTTYGSDSEITFKFSNKTPSGLDISLTTELLADGGDSTIDEASLTIKGGFGTIVLGNNDGAGDTYGVAAADLIAEETAPTQMSATIGTGSDIGQGDLDADKVVYHLPAMADGALTAGASFANAGEEGNADSTAYGVKYTADAGGAAITVGAATQTTENALKDVETSNIGIKVVSGDASFIVSQGSSESNDEDIETNGFAASYKMANGMTVGAYTVNSEDDKDAGEEYERTGVEVQYTIASGLTAYINVDDYEYKTGASSSTTADSGTNSKLTIKATF